ncbi:MAG: AAA family ATPase [Alphaproteobacteria bacterium]|nr:AAA family ATPase [Alphaproteobacteria bacterium]
MYETFYGLSGKPFSLLPDGDALFPSKRHRRALSMLEYGVVSQAGFVVISGEVGAGKTTVVRHFLKNVRPDIAVGIITNPSASIGRLFDWIALAFDLQKRGADDPALYDAFVAFLLAQYAQGRRALLIIDEAQNLTRQMLEDLRMLSNVNNERDMLLQIVLVGQPEMLDTLQRADLRQFVQRIAAHCHLDSLSAAETAAYIRYRLNLAGGDAKLFDDLACAAVYRFTGGVPRLVNLLCDQALVYGFAEDMPRIPFKTIAEVAIDRSRFGLSAFRNVPESLSPAQLKDDLKTVLKEIRQGWQKGSAEE